VPSSRALFSRNLDFGLGILLLATGCTLGFICGTPISRIRWTLGWWDEPHPSQPPSSSCVTDEVSSVSCVEGGGPCGEWNDAEDNRGLGNSAAEITTNPTEIASSAYVAELQARICYLDDALEAERKARRSERSSRISAQQQARQSLLEQARHEGFTYRPIGTVRSIFHDRRGTPRQPALVPSSRGRIVFDPRLVQIDHYRELEQFSHIWVRVMS
jgi:hypothetical protein